MGKAQGVIKKGGYFDISNRNWVVDENMILLAERRPDYLKYNGSHNLLSDEMERRLKELNKMNFHSAGVLFYCYYNIETEECGYSLSRPLSFLDGASRGVNSNHVVFRCPELDLNAIYPQKAVNLVARVFGKQEYGMSINGILMVKKKVCFQTCWDS